MAISTNHSEIIVLYEASKVCVWLHRMMNHILKSCGADCIQSSTIIYEDNVAYVVQMENSYIKKNITKHIAPKLFYPHELQKNGEINVLQTKSLPYSTSLKYVEGIGMRQLRELQESGGVSLSKI